MAFCVKNKKGFTLIEILITMAVVSIIMVAVVAAFDVQQKSQVKQQLISEVQQNARAAMYLLAWDVRMAGYALGEGKIQIPDNDSETMRYIKAIEIYPNEATGKKTDIVEILYADSTTKASITDGMPVPSSNFKVDDTTGFDICDLIIVSDSVQSTILEVTHIQSDKMIQHNPSSCSGEINQSLGWDVTNDKFKHAGGFGPGAEIHKLRYLAYSVQDEDSAHPWLGKDKNGDLDGYNYERFVDDIEDLQAVYIFEDEDEASIYNDADMDDTNDFDDIRAVRITIVARTRVEHKGFKGSRKPALEGNSAGPVDWYGRRVLSLELKIRNIAL